MRWLLSLFAFVAFSLGASASGQTWQPQPLPAQIKWWGPHLPGYTGQVYFDSAQAACDDQHQFWNPGAPAQPATYGDASHWACHWTAKQAGGGDPANTILPTGVEAICVASGGVGWTIQQATNSCEEVTQIRAAACPICEAHRASPPYTSPRLLGGDPIQYESGAVVRTETDYESADGLLRVDRHYRSGFRNISYIAPIEVPGFGAHWFGLYPGRAYAGGWPVPIEYLPSEGGQLVWQNYSNDPSWWGWIANSQNQAKLSFPTNPSGYRLEYLLADSPSFNSTIEVKISFADGGYLGFHRGGKGWLLPIEEGWASGYKRYFDYNVPGGSYDGSQLLPYQIRDSFGRTLALTWTLPLRSDGSTTAVAAALTNIGLPDGTSLRYSYDTALKDRLLAVARLSSSGAPLWGRSYLYENTTFPYAVTGVLDQSGNRITTYSYDASGYAASTEQAGGVNKYTLLNEYGGSSWRRRTVTNPLGRVEQYVYWHDDGGWGNIDKRLQSVSNFASANIPASNRAYNYYYYVPTNVQDERGNSTSYASYDANWRPATITEAGGLNEQRSTTVTWHPTYDLPLSEVRSGLTVSYTYDLNGALLTRTETDTTTQSVPYSTAGQKRTWTYVWNTNGRLASMTSPRPAVGGKLEKTTYAYDSVGNLTTQTNGLGQTTGFANYDANGRPGSMTDANGIVTTFSYDGLGRTKTITVKHPTTASLDAITSFDYDVEGRVVGITLPSTDTLVTDYDLAGRVTAIRAASGERIDYVRNGMGGVTSETITRADGSVRSTITRTFDELNRILTLTLGPGRITSYQYDLVGNQTQNIGGRSNATTYAFDGLNRLVGSTASDGGATATKYDLSDGQTSFTDPINVQTTFVRNGFGEAISETSPDRGTSVYYYNPSGEVIASIDGRGQRIDYTRDLLGRITKKVPAGRPTSETITYYWDGGGVGSYQKGRLGKVVDGTGTTSFQYDHRGNLLLKRQAIGTTTSANLSYSYDLADRVTQITYPSGRIVQYLRDTKGRVTKIQTKASASVTSWTVLSQNMTYEAFGPLKSYVLGNGITMSQDWGTDQRLYAKSYKKSDGTALWSVTYTYDNDDNITGITDLVDPTRSLTFGYDSESRLTRSLAAQGPSRQVDYLFDKNGNRTRMEARDDPAQGQPTTATDYTLAAGTNRLSSVGAAPYQRVIGYDGRGNTSTETRPGGISVSVAYDGYARLTNYTRTGDPTKDNVYNGLDDRVQVTTTTQGVPDVRRYVYNRDGRIMGEYGVSAADVKGEWIWLQPSAGEGGSFGGGDGASGYALAAVAYGPPATPVIDYQLVDHLGRQVAMTGTTGGTTAPGPYTLSGYPGQLRTLSDLYYNRYRDYDPSTGRYVQADPIGLNGGINLYNYVGGNPLRKLDPLGRQAIVLGAEGGAEVGAIFGPAGAVVGGIVGGVGAGLGGDYLVQKFKRWCHGNCQPLYDAITEARNELAERLQDYREDKYNLPAYGPNSRAGHVNQIRGWQRRLQKLLAEANSNGCTSYESDAWYFATVQIDRRY